MPETRQLFRVVKFTPPTLRDFLPQVLTQPNRRPRANSTPDELRLYLAISHWTTLAGAQKMARRLPAMGEYIAELLLPAEAPITIAEGSSGHVNVWGDPEVLLSSVFRISRV